MLSKIDKKVVTTKLKRENMIPNNILYQLKQTPKSFRSDYEAERYAQFDGKGFRYIMKKKNSFYVIRWMADRRILEANGFELIKITYRERN